MIQAGVLTENDPVELLEGWIISKMPCNPLHDGAILLAQTTLLAALSNDWVLRVQSTITLRDSESEPDLVVALSPVPRYYSAHPAPRDLALVVEVSDTTLKDDRETKGRVYARARLPIYWILNLVESVVEVYTRPKAGKAPAYQQRDDYAKGEAVPLVIKGQEVARIPVRGFLP
jgi:hypothetical protein